MRWFIVSIAFILSACSGPVDLASPYPKLIRNLDVGPDADAVFVSAEDHAKCAGFHRAFAQLATGTQNKAEFYNAAAADAEVAAVEIAKSKIFQGTREGYGSAIGGDSRCKMGLCD